MHGGGHTVRQREGIRLSPQQAGQLSRLARRIKRDGTADLSVVPSMFPWLREREATLNTAAPEVLDLRQDIVKLTARGMMATPNLIEVPLGALSAEALRGVIEEYVTRAGTDYGAREKAIEEKIADVNRQLERGEAIIVFDPDAETTNIVSRS